MPITTSISADQATLTVHVDGRFDFKQHAEFRRAYEAASPRPLRFVVDLSKAEYIDSSALGMLLLLKQHAGGESSAVALANVQPPIAKVLNFANFTKLFMVA